MTATIQKFGLALVLALFGMAVPPLARVAAAQNPDVPIGLDLNGVWELEEHGQRLDAAPPLVELQHRGGSVTAVFITGSKCFDGTDRTFAFDATLTGQPTVPPVWTFSSGDMWVCSNSPSVVAKCGMSAKYETAIATASVTADQITGRRFRLITDECSSTRESQASGSFSLRRLQPCEQEHRKYDEETEDARFLLTRITSLREVINRGIEAAQDRYGPMFNGQPTSVLTYPVQYVAVDFTDAAELEAYFAAMPEFIDYPDWTAARRMAEDMAGGNNPLPEARAMAVEMRRIEGFLPEGRQQLNSLRSAREALSACRQAQQR